MAKTQGEKISLWVLLQLFCWVCVSGLYDLLLRLRHKWKVAVSRLLSMWNLTNCMSV